jgi:hypothetical protein
MTTNNTTARCRHIAATTVILLGSVAVATTTATTAEARIKNGAADFNQCIVDAVRYNLDHGQDVNINAIKIGCCASIGGDVVTEADGLTFKDCIFHSTTEPGATSSTNRPTIVAPLPPDATNIEHP